MARVFLLCFLSFMLGHAQTDTIIDYAAGKIHLKTFGTGDPILIINGGPGMNSEGFETLATQLATSHRAILYDQRGTGQSQITAIDSQTMTLDNMVADIEVIRKSLKLENWIVFGHSFGGMLASYYTSKHPKQVKGLILSSSGGTDLALLSDLDIRSALTTEQRDSLNYWTRQIANGDNSYHAQLQRGRFLAPAYLYTDDFVDQVAQRLTQGNRTINGLIWQHMRAINFNCKAALKHFKNPVLVLQGAHDIIGRHIAVDTHELFENSTLVFVEKSAHYGWLENPEQYLGAIHQFLRQLN